MNTVKAALAALIVTTGSAVGAAAADMPVAPGYAPLRLQAAPIEHARLVCNPFRCFRVGPPPVFYGPPVIYRAPRVYAPVYQGPEYEVRRSYPQRRFEAPEYEYRRSEEVRRSYSTRGYDGDAGEFRRPHHYDRSERDGRREEWSHEYSRSEGGEERD